MRQYIIADNNEELPFKPRRARLDLPLRRRARTTTSGSGPTTNPLDRLYPIIKHAVFPYGEGNSAGAGHDEMQEVPGAKTLGEVHARARRGGPTSIVNISAMIFGAVGSNAGRGPQQGREARALLPQHRRGRHLAAPTSTAAT